MTEKVQARHTHSRKAVIVRCCLKLNDTTFTIGSSDETGARVYLTDTDFKDFAVQEFVYPDETLEYDICTGVPIYKSDRSFNMLVVAEDHHGITLPEEYDESFDDES